MVGTAARNSTRCAGRCVRAARRPAQLVLFRIAVPTTPAQTVSRSIPIIKRIEQNMTGTEADILGINLTPNRYTALAPAIVYVNNLRHNPI